MLNIKTSDVLVALALILSLVNVALIVSNNNGLAAINSQMIQMNSSLNSLKSELASLQSELNVVKASYYPLVVEDALGRVVTIKSEPMRIVSGSPTITETLFALGLSGRVVGADSYSNYPPEFVSLKQEGKIAVVGGVTTLDPEKVAAQRPDLVVIDASLQAKFIPALESLGLTVVAVEAESVDNVMENFQMLAKITFKLGEGLRIVDQLESAVQAVSDKVSSSNATKVLFLVWHDPMYSAAGGTYLNELITIAGGNNIVGDRTGWAVVNPEQVVALNPSVIILSSMSLSMDPEEMFSYFRSLPGFENVDAVKNNRMYILTEDASNALERAGPRLSDGIYILGCILHPEAFGTQLPNVLAANYSVYLGR
ncbi:MAG: ABC transporter substrate-binding protein [Candidatus Verstraetearchaeota archaeon]|nr:ABC transporter substrate-binding protein [Candidatus Verstraetearchaeota archaeon]